MLCVQERYSGLSTTSEDRYDGPSSDVAVSPLESHDSSTRNEVAVDITKGLAQTGADDGGAVAGLVGFCGMASLCSLHEPTRGVQSAEETELQLSGSYSSFNNANRAITSIVGRREGVVCGIASSRSVCAARRELRAASR